MTGTLRTPVHNEKRSHYDTSSCRIELIIAQKVRNYLPTNDTEEVERSDQKDLQVVSSLAYNEIVRRRSTFTVMRTGLTRGGTTIE